MAFAHFFIFEVGAIGAEVDDGDLIIGSFGYLAMLAAESFFVDLDIAGRVSANDDVVFGDLVGGEDIP